MITHYLYNIDRLQNYLYNANTIYIAYRTRPCLPKKTFYHLYNYIRNPRENMNDYIGLLKKIA